MKHNCKYCGKEYNLLDWQERLVEINESEDYCSDIEPDDDISPYRLNIEINPAKYTGIGDDDPEERIFSELYSVMCDDCKKDLLNDLKLTIYKWKTLKENGQTSI